MTVTGGNSEPLIAPARYDVGGRSSQTTSVFTLASTCIGSGILSFPFAFSQAGVVLGSVIFLAFACLLGFSLYVVVLSVTIAQRQDPRVVEFQDLVEFCGGRSLALVMEFSMSVYLFGAALAMFIIIVDSATPLFSVIVGCCSGQHFASDPAMLDMLSFVFAACLLIPLCAQRTLNALRYVTRFAVCGIGYMVVMVVGKYWSMLPNVETASVHEFRFGSSVYMSMPIFVYALGCHLAAPIIFHNMHPNIRTVATFSRVATYAYAIAIAFYLPLGVFGYMSFGELTPEDILAPPAAGSSKGGYQMTDVFADLARAAVVFNTSAAFSLVWFPARAMLVSFVSRFRASRKIVKHGEVHDAVGSEMLHWSTLLWSAVLWVGAAAAIAARFRHLGLLFDLLGAIFGSFEVFFYPALFWWCLCAGSSSLGSVPAYVLLAVGALTMVAGIAAVFRSDLA